VKTSSVCSAGRPVAAKFKPSAELAADVAQSLSSYLAVLHKHKDEISRDVSGFREWARRRFNLLQPQKRAGRPLDENVTRAMELRLQNKPWQQVYAIVLTETEGEDAQAAQERLREAVRARRARLRRRKNRTNETADS
jgi:hypothetical protein